MKITHEHLTTRFKKKFFFIQKFKNNGQTPFSQEYSVSFQKTCKSFAGNFGISNDIHFDYTFFGEVE